MSKIPYYFNNPVPKYFKENGWLKNPKTRAFICFCFDRICFEEREIQHDGQRIMLKPFQFIFGRKACSEETGLTEDEIRTQQKNLENSNFLKKAPNKTPSRFTIYEFVSEAFLKRDPQVNPQVTPKSPPSDPHNLDIRQQQQRGSDLIDMTEVNKKIENIDKEYLVIRTPSGSGVDRLSVQDLKKQLVQELFTLEEIEFAVGRIREQNPVISAPVEYIKSIIINHRKDNARAKSNTRNKNTPKGKISGITESFIREACYD